jgi:hypothetical protein
MIAADVGRADAAVGAGGVRHGSAEPASLPRALVNGCLSVLFEIASRQPHRFSPVGS